MTTRTSAVDTRSTWQSWDTSALGPARVGPDVLATLVNRQLGLPETAEVALLEASVEVVPYDIDALTTAGRWWVRGRVQTPVGPWSFSFFVKAVQSWARTPAFAFVPPHVREAALAGLRWDVEPLVYRSTLSERLPAGLAMPEVYAVLDIDDESAAIWLEDVQFRHEPWELDRFGSAARLLGRMAASDAVRDSVRSIRDDGQSRMRGYAEGRVVHQVIPGLRADEVWQHPLVADSFDGDLRARLLAAADDLESVVQELEAMPLLAIHGDACTRNLLMRTDESEFVLIDFGMVGEGPVGFDLGQLVLGEVQLGERPAGDLQQLESACLTAYVGGLEDEGSPIDLEVVRRAHALHMLLFTGLSCLPFEHLDRPATEELHRISAQRAAMARFVLDLVEETS